MTVVDGVGNIVEAEADSGAEQSLGTRFLVFPQPSYVPGYEKPEVVWLAPSRERIHVGPADSRMYVIDPVNAKSPYVAPVLPPYAGRVRPAAEPGPDGHFDHITPSSPAFLSTHSYACARRVLDICEGYLGRRMIWFFEPELSRLEIVPHIADWDNAQSGFGFLELGESGTGRSTASFALNFDSVAHEMGHLVLLSELGLFERKAANSEFFAYHEAVADFISLLGLLHFDSAIDRILRRTKGELLIHNELDRFAELSDEKQIRSFNNSLRMGDVGEEVHDHSRPFAAALFDCLLEVHQALLYERGLSDIDPRQYSDLRHQLAPMQIENKLHAARGEYETRHFATKAALQEARDIVGESLFGSWRYLHPDSLSLRTAAESFLEVADRGRARPFVNQFEDCLRWRDVLG